MAKDKTVVAYQIKANGEHQAIDMKLELSDYYKYTECDIIDIVYATIGNKNYDIIVDDEGLLKSNRTFTAFTIKSGVLLAGSIVIVGSNGKGGFKSLSDKDLLNIKENLHTTEHMGNENLAPTMVEFEYAYYN